MHIHIQCTGPKQHVQNLVLNGYEQRHAEVIAKALGLNKCSICGEHINWYITDGLPDPKEPRVVLDRDEPEDADESAK